MSRRLLARVAWLVVLCTAVFVQAAAAQNICGSLVGNVTDTSGAYTIPNTPSGTYGVAVTVPGFQTFIAQNISVTNRVVAVGWQKVVAGP